MPEKLLKHKLILEILDKYRVIWSLGHLSALADWDMNVYMPEEGVVARGEALGKVSSLAQELFLDKKFVELIKKTSNETDLNDYEKGIIRLLNRQLKYYEKLPKEFIEEFVKTTSESHVAWRTAREKKDFSIFSPYLKKIVELSKKKAQYLGYEKHPYDALLDGYEEGLTTEDLEKYFLKIKQPIIDLVKKIKFSKEFKSEHSLENEKYDIEKMKELNRIFLETIHYNLDHIRIDTSPHPFSTTIGPNDYRITTRYEGIDFARSFSAAIHEYGHSLYEIQSHQDFHYTPIAGGTSLVIHESQSRFWENIIGRSHEFIEIFYKNIQELSKDISKYSIEDIYNYFNLVKPSLIRVEADEVTYHLHILIRFEIEKDLIEGKINVDDLPRIWNEKYKEYLGIVPKDDSEGVLQDIHWSQGSIGYFPTYSLGTALSLMWKNKLNEDLGNINNLIKTKDGIKKIQDWLKDKIHQYGSTYLFKDLVKKTTGKEFDPKYLLDYLNIKYSRIYKLIP